MRVKNIGAPAQRADGGEARKRLGERAFSRVDLVVVVMSAIFLLGWLTYRFTGERGRIIHCAHNLKQLGQAIEEYAGDHDGKLPSAAFEPTGTTWDWAVMRYLRADLYQSNSAYADRLLREAVASRFVCPSDKLARIRPRTYAMSEYEMRPENWPPEPSNIMGIGLVWNDRQAVKVMKKDLWEQLKVAPQNLPGIKLALILVPARTTLLTELVMADNQIGSLANVTVGGGQNQSQRFQGDRPQFHFGGFNYLMADGHVDLKTSMASHAGGSELLPAPFDFDESDEPDGGGTADKP